MHLASIETVLAMIWRNIERTAVTWPIEVKHFLTAVTCQAKALQDVFKQFEVVRSHRDGLQCKLLSAAVATH